MADIQALRGVAVIWVFFQHLSLTPALFAFLPKKIEMPFYCGVELFFVISGFVITLSLSKSGFNVRKFLIKRLFRLTPSVICVIVFSALVRQCIILEGVTGFNKSLFVPQAAHFIRESFSVLGGYFLLVTKEPSYYFSAMWTLSVEDQFYVT